MKSCYLRQVSIGEEHNREIQMIQQTPTTFVCLMNRVGAAPVKRSYPMSRWDRVYSEKINKGYTDVTRYHEKVSNSKFQEIADPEVRKFFSSIENYSNEALKKNYLESYDKVTAKMLQEAKEILEKISQYKDRDEVNAELIRLFNVIPRKMDNVASYLWNDTSQPLGDILAREWDLLRIMEARVKKPEITEKPKDDILTYLGLKISPVHDKKEIDTIKRYLTPESAPRLKNVFRVSNRHTDQRFYSHMEKHGYSESDIHYYYHGSRNENWYGLIKNGPLLMPKGVIITGKAFGNGIYFANRARKSIGYTSLRDAYWTNGTSNTGYIGIYKVLYKNAKHVKIHGNYSLRNIRPCDAVFAHKGLDLKNDEIIIYREEQATLQYIMELN